MNRQGNSYHQILRSSSIVGGATVVNILCGLIRIKVAAIVLGPLGIGYIGLLQNLLGTAATVASLGLRTSGTQMIAEALALGSPAALAASRRSLFWGSLMLACIGGLSFWLARDILAANLLRPGEPAIQIGWLSIGVALTVMAGSQSAFMNGMRKVGHLAWVSVISSALATAVGIAALLFFSEYGVIALVLIIPICNVLVGYLFIRRLKTLVMPLSSFIDIVTNMRGLIARGTIYMLSGLVVTAGELVLRSFITRELGAAALGQFQASWTISVTYMGLIVVAMSTDYFPRLSGIIRDHEASNKLVNQQTEVTLLFAAPLVLFLIAGGSSIIDLMYSKEFGPATEILRWQILGDVFKIASWPLGYILLASGNAKAFFMYESSTTIFYVLVCWFGMPYFGLYITGIGYLIMYATALPVLYLLANRRSGFVWTRGVSYEFVGMACAATIVFMVTSYHHFGGLILGLSLSLVATFRSLRRIGQMIDPETKAGQLLTRVRDVAVRTRLLGGR